MTRMDEQRRGAWRDAAALLGLSSVLRAAYWWAVPRMLDSADAVRYLETAHTLADRDFLALDPKIPLLYPALVAHARLFFSDFEIAGQAVSFIFSALLVVPVYFLGRTLHGAAAGRIAGALVALWPWLIDYSNRVATEPLAVFLWVTGALCLLRGLQPQGDLRWMFGAILSFGGLQFARAEGTFILLGAAGMFAFLPRSEWPGARRRLGVYAAGTAAVLAAYALYIHKLTGTWTVNYRAGFIGEQPEGSTVLADLGKTLVAMTADVPAVMLGPLLWAFFGIGLVATGSGGPRRWRSEAAVLYLAALQWLIVIPVLSPAPRYLMAAFVALLPWVARGLCVAGDRLAVLTGRQWTQRLPVAVVALWFALHLGAAVAAERWSGAPAQPWEYKIAGEWMREHLEPGIIVTRKPQVGFYAEMPTAGMAADATLDEIIDTAREAGCRYLVIDERYTTGLVPSLASLRDPASAPATVRLVNADLSPYPDTRIVIYEFISK